MDEGSIFKQEKGTVLTPRSGSQRRAVPAALWEVSEAVFGVFQTIKEKFTRCRFCAVGARLRCRKNGFP